MNASTRSGIGPEVVVLHLLALRRPRAEERAAGVDQVGPVEIELPVDQEVLLLRPAGGRDALRLGPEQLQDADRLLRQRLHRAQQRRLLVERLTGPADERGRDDERRAVRGHEQPRRAGRIPRGVAARLEGRAHAARRETRRVRLALDQLLAAELRDRAAVGGRREKRVVLLGRDAGHRLEPVRVVRGAVFDRPVLQRAGDDVGDTGSIASPWATARRSARYTSFGSRARCTSSLNVSEPNSSVALRFGCARARAERHAPVGDAADGVVCGCGGTHRVCPFVGWESRHYASLCAGSASSGKDGFR